MAASPGEAAGQTPQPPIRSATISSGRYYGVARWAVASQPGGAAIAANLLARRNDIACAVLGSGPLALQAQLALQGADRAVLHDLDDPIRHVHAIAADPYRRIFVLSDEADQLVPLSVQHPWVERAGARGLAVEHLVRQGWGGGPLHHDLTWQAVDVASLCANEATTAEIAAKTGGGEGPAMATLAQVTVGGG